MIIDSVSLRNFQGYEDETIKLHPHFNVLVGTGNAGKSAIIRALSFLLYGTWNSKWVRWNQDFAEAALTTTDGIVVTRQKGEKVNKFILEVPGKETQVYENFGKNTPDEISSVLKIFKADLGGKEELLLNLSAQHDPLFLLSQPGSFKAKVLGKLSGGHFLDYALKEINKDKKNLSAEKHLKEIEVVDIEKQLVFYRDLDNQKKQIESVGLKLHQIEQRSRYVEQLKKLNERVQAWKQNYLQDCEEEKKLNSFSEQVATNLFDKISKLGKLKQLQQKLSTTEEQAKKVQEELIYLKDCINFNVEQYFKLLKENKKCPTCFTEIDEQQLEKVKSSL